jgi:hypothetical protein
MRIPQGDPADIGNRIALRSSYDAFSGLEQAGKSAKLELSMPTILFFSGIWLCPLWFILEYSSASKQWLGNLKHRIAYPILFH